MQRGGRWFEFTTATTNLISNRPHNAGSRYAEHSHARSGVVGLALKEKQRSV